MEDFIDSFLGLVLLISGICGIILLMEFVRWACKYLFDVDIFGRR